MDDEREHEDLQRQVNFYIFFCQQKLSIFSRAFVFSFFTFQLSSRNSSPDNDFVDVEGTERPHSSASASSQKFDGPSVIPALPEIKRGRGRPRKNRDNLEEGKSFGCHQCWGFFLHFFFLNSMECIKICNSFEFARAW